MIGHTATRSLTKPPMTATAPHDSLARLIGGQPHPADATTHPDATVARPVRRIGSLTAAVAIGYSAAALAIPPANADNNRLNNSVVSNVYTTQHQAGCTNDLKIDPPLRLAAQWHTDDLLANRDLDGDVGSDGTMPQDRANAARYQGAVAETVAINPALAISGIELINQWYNNPSYLAIMRNCAYSQIGVWSESSLDRTVVVAVYGHPR